MNSFFDYDPYQAGFNSAENTYLKVIAKIMKKVGITQIDISNVDLSSTDEIAIEDWHNFFRIKCNFELEEK